MNTNLLERTSILQNLCDLFPLFKVDELLSTTKTVERAQYLLDYCKAMKAKNQDALSNLRAGCKRDIETRKTVNDQEEKAA